MEILTGLIALAAEISIRHVLVLNLVGWMIKCFLRHRGSEDWTDVIPIFLALVGVVLAYVDRTLYPWNFIIHGLANAGMAWLLHQTMKQSTSVWSKVKDKYDARTRDKQF